MPWRCLECGEVTDESAACPECGSEVLEPAERQADDGPRGEPNDPVFVCTNCGRAHPKHSPPCSRCGSMTLEKESPEYTDVEVTSTSYLDVLEARYVLGYVLVFAVVGAGLLSAAGVITLPVIGGPTIPDAPGHGETYANVSLAAVEDAYVEELNAERETRGETALSTGSTLERMAAYYNKRTVEAVYGTPDPPTQEELLSNFDPDCGRSIVLHPAAVRSDSVVTATFASGDATATGQALRAAMRDEGDVGYGEEFDTVGVDVHVGPDDAVYVTVLVC